MVAELSGKRSLNRIIGIATALMCSLAAGAVWCVLQLYSRIDLIGLSLVVGAMIAWILRRQGYAHSVGGALLAAGCTAIACAYAGYLLAAAKVASFLGIPMRSTLTTIGPDMAGAIAWADLTPFHIGTLVLAVVLSAWMVWRRK